MEDTLKKSELELDVTEPIAGIDSSWRDYIITDEFLSPEEIEELIDTRGISSTDCLEWWLALRIDAGRDEWDWYDGNTEDMPERFKEMNGFFNFPEAFKLFKDAKLEKGEALLLNFMPEDIDDPEYGDISVLEKVGGEKMSEDLDLDPVDETEEILIIEAINRFLEEEEGTAANVERAFPEEQYGYNSHVYVNTEDDSEWLVCTYDEAESYAREDFESLIDDLGPVEAFGYETVEGYLDEDHFNEILEEDVRYRVDDMDDDELIDEMESYGVIDEDDMIEDPDWEPDEDLPEDEPDMIYPEDLLENKKEELIDKMINSYSSGIEYMEEIYGDLADYVKENPDCVDTDRLIDDMLSYDGFGNTLARYDGYEHELSYEDENGNTKYLYAYKIN